MIDVKPLIRGFLKNLPMMKPEWMVALGPLFDADWEKPRTPTHSDFQAMLGDVPRCGNVIIPGTLNGKRITAFVQFEDRSIIPEDLKKILEKR
jgi:hypothetical protein